MNPTNNQHVLNWLNEMAAMTKPDNIVWIDGSEEQVAALRKEALASGEIIQLNQEKLPGCYLHRTTWDDVARVEGRTFICTKTKEDAGNINNWMDPAECRAKLTKLYTGCMKGRTMYVIPYSMSIVGSPFAKYGIELTDSIYVVLNMEIMTRVGFNVLEALGDSSDFIKGLHSKATLDAENRYIVHFPEDDTIWSINSNYGGNVLLGKKCFALRIASYLGRKEGWMAEHMLILGVTYPDGTKKYVTAAFPSACGKTNLALAAFRDANDALNAKSNCQPGERLLRRCTRHQREVQPQRTAHLHEGHHLYQRVPEYRYQYGLVGGTG